MKDTKESQYLINPNLYSTPRPMKKYLLTALLPCILLCPAVRSAQNTLDTSRETANKKMKKRPKSKDISAGMSDSLSSDRPAGSGNVNLPSKETTTSQHAGLSTAYMIPEMDFGTI